jgi:cytoskeletal protein CcmA (bactofilin family)
VFGRSAKNAQSNLPKPPANPARSGSQGPAPARPEGFPIDPTVSTGTSVIGNDLTILGERITIISQNKLQIDGHVHGDVHGKQVVISKYGSVTGKVCAERIEVRGAVTGSIRALAVALHESAKVDGDIVHQTLSISEGAEFNGRVQRAKDASELMPILDAEAFASQYGKDNDEASHFGRDDDDASLGLDHPASPRINR